LSRPRVLVIGDLLYDVLAQLDGPPNPGTDTFAPVHAQPGGSGANAAAWLTHAGVETCFVARVGDDPLGRMLQEELRELGVATHLIRDAELPTGKVVVLVDGAGERTMITSRGAGENLHPEDLPGHAFRADAHLHLSGYLFSEGARRQTALEALRRARLSRMTVSIDPSSTTLLTELGPQRFLEWTRGADLLFPNHEEGALLADTRDIDGILEALLDHYPRVALKLGPEGVAYAARDGVRVDTPAAPARTIDTTGAGDALCAGFLAAWLRDESPNTASKKGAELAARAVQRVGGRPELDAGAR
jgi:sugar/nucleoside kinase (ribokinase family)